MKIIPNVPAAFYNYVVPLMKKFVRDPKFKGALIGFFLFLKIGKEKILVQTRGIVNVTYGNDSSWHAVTDRTLVKDRTQSAEDAAQHGQRYVPLDVNFPASTELGILARSTKNVYNEIGYISSKYAASTPLIRADDSLALAAVPTVDVPYSQLTIQLFTTISAWPTPEFDTYAYKNFVHVQYFYIDSGLSQAETLLLPVAMLADMYPISQPKDLYVYNPALPNGYANRTLLFQQGIYQPRIGTVAEFVDNRFVTKAVSFFTTWSYYFSETAGTGNGIYLTIVSNAKLRKAQLVSYDISKLLVANGLPPLNFPNFYLDFATSYYRTFGVIFRVMGEREAVSSTLILLNADTDIGQDFNYYRITTVLKCTDNNDFTQETSLNFMFKVIFPGTDFPAPYRSLYGQPIFSGNSTNIVVQYNIEDTYITVRLLRLYHTYTDLDGGSGTFDRWEIYLITETESIVNGIYSYTPVVTYVDNTPYAGEYTQRLFYTDYEYVDSYVNSVEPFPTGGGIYIAGLHDESRDSTFAPVTYFFDTDGNFFIEYRKTNDDTVLHISTDGASSLVYKQLDELTYHGIAVSAVDINLFDNVDWRRVWFAEATQIIAYSYGLRQSLTYSPYTFGDIPVMSMLSKYYDFDENVIVFIVRVVFGNQVIIVGSTKFSVKPGDNFYAYADNDTAQTIVGSANYSFLIGDKYSSPRAQYIQIPVEITELRYFDTDTSEQKAKIIIDETVIYKITPEKIVTEFARLPVHNNNLGIAALFTPDTDIIITEAYDDDAQTLTYVVFEGSGSVILQNTVSTSDLIGLEDNVVYDAPRNLIYAYGFVLEYKDGSWRKKASSDYVFPASTDTEYLISPSAWNYNDTITSREQEKLWLKELEAATGMTITNI